MLLAYSEKLQLSGVSTVNVYGLVLWVVLAAAIKLGLSILSAALYERIKLWGCFDKFGL